PGGITAISAMAFSDNRLTGVTIPSSVTVIEGNAFSFNEISAVVIPDSVREIKKGAFGDNPLTSITIGSDVVLHKTAVPHGFAGFYNHKKVGKKAGTYVFDNFAWTIR
ncbi:MAG: leucine-rich repeat domain-containing protein, partial [Treponema sp.]|nr:leucine-rich repeat domain-containing protein [Treponema sp.]